jgi:hypothetical protein
MSNKLKTYQIRADKISKRLKNLAHDERKKLATEIRNKILLPFCKKHNLTLNINIYEDNFTLPNGDIYSDYDIHKVINDPMANEIGDYLGLSYMGDNVFDYHMNMDITKEDLLK